MDNEIQLLKEAAIEIKMLRRQNEIMSARLGVFDDLMSMLNTSPAYKTQGMSPDVVYAIERAVSNFEDKKSKPTVTSN